MGLEPLHRQFLELLAALVRGDGHDALMAVQQLEKLVTVQLFTTNTSAGSPSCTMVKPLERNICSRAPVSFRLTLQPSV